MIRPLLRLLLGCATIAHFAARAIADDTSALVERFDPLEAYRVELKVTVSGRLAVPLEKGKPPEVLTLEGASTLLYDERPLPTDEAKSERLIRIYRDIEMKRTIGGKEQKAEVRPSVRRMVVLRSDRGKKAPFSPDGPLTWGEIDVVRTDVFSPALVVGLLPANPVRPGDKWNLTAAGVAELTDLDPVEEGSLTAKFDGVVMLDNRRYAKLSIGGTVKGSTEDGPARHKLDGLGYFDLDTSRLTYLNLAGTRELLGADGKTVVGQINGKFVLNRKPIVRVPELSEAALKALELKPTPDNSLLLYDNPDLGVRFLYPRRWRVGAIQGQQLTLEESKGGGILLTLDPADKLTTAAQYAAETKAFLTQQKWALLGYDPPRRWADKPLLVDRFAFDAEKGTEKVRMDYAVASHADGGLTVAARLPWAERVELVGDLDRILRSMTIIKRIEK